MDSRAFRDVLCEGPQPALLEAVIAGREPKDILPPLDLELHRSLVRMQRLNECRNWLASPIHRLHPEILQMIIFMYAQDNDELFDMRWARLLRVCKRWHDILVHTSMLWSFIDVSSLDTRERRGSTDARDLQRIAVQRSSAGLWPLTIRVRTNIHYKGSLPETKLALISSEFWHPRSLSSLSVGGNSIIIHALLQQLAAHRQPILAELVMRNSSYDDNRLELRSLLNVALKRQTPKLHHLSLSGLAFSWAHIHDLRTLHVDYGYHCRPKGCNSLSPDMTDALSRCPLLERLHIGFPHVYPDEVVTSQAAVSLPNLRELFMDGPDMECYSLLQNIVHLPASARIIIIGYNGWRRVKYTSPLASYLGHHVSQVGAPVIRTIVLDFDRMEREDVTMPPWVLAVVGRTCLQASVDEWDRHTFLPSHKESVGSHIGLETTLQIRAGDDSDIIAGPVKDVLRSWPLDRVNDLDMRSARFKAAHLNTLFLMFPHATTVVVRPESQFAVNLLVILRAHLRVHKQRVFANIIFDAERILRDEPSWRSGPPGGVLARRTLILTLLYCAEAAQAGVPLDTVEIVNEGRSAKNEPLLKPSADFDWTELSSHVSDGFICMGVLHSTREDRDGLQMEFPRVIAS
ncbi:hypothetical protein PENSPDRAFT_693349 [Peniophora sp. CONT]|nr:hypothetical protein PENSPDRAFT_693349 [Peniophora sp. CONT]